MTPDIGLPPGAGGPRPSSFPTGRPGEPVARPGTTPLPGGVREGVGVGRPVEVTPPLPSPAAAEAPAAVPAKAEPQIRPLTVQDIANHLLALQMRPTKENVQLASLMLKYGIELSRTNFDQLAAMIQNRGGQVSMQESALALLTKGITNSPEAVNILAEQLASNPQLASQVNALQQEIANMQAALSANQNLFSPALITKLTALLAQVDTNLMNLLKRNFTEGGHPALKRGELMNNLRALKSIMQGVQDKMIEAGSRATSATEILSSSLMSMVHKLGGLINNLTAQALLSQQAARSDMADANYAYWQIPYGGPPPKNMEMIVKRDGSEPKSAINPENTRIIMSLETEHLGKMTVDMTVKEKKVDFTFNTQNEEVRSFIAAQTWELMNKVTYRNFIPARVWVRVDMARSTIKPFLIPLHGLDDLMRINTEA